MSAREGGPGLSRRCGRSRGRGSGRASRGVLGAVAAGVLAALGCGGAEPVPGELRINLRTEPPTLDWNKATDNTSFHVIQELMRGLTQLTPELEVAPALAEGWEISPDGRTYTFRLRRDVRWSDGVPLHAQQFVDSWQRLLAPATAAEYAYFLYPVRNARALNAGELDDPDALGVRALDAHTLEVTLAEPLVYFPALVNFMVTFPIRRELIERHGDQWTEPENMVTLGAFRLAEWRHEYRLTLEANPDFFEGRPALDRVVGYMIDEYATALVLFEQGELDWVDVPPLEIRSYQDDPRFVSTPGLRGYYYGFDSAEPPFDDPRVRRAFAHAIDRRAFPEVLKGGEIPWASWIPPGMPFSNAGIGLEFSPERARALLREAGVDPAALGPVRVVYNSDQTNKLVAEKVQAQWREHLGVQVELENREWKVYLKELQLDPPPVYRLGWGADFPDADNFMNLFASYSDNNHSRWGSPRYDALVEAAALARDPAERQRLYDEAQVILCERELPIVPLFVATFNKVIAARVHGFEPNAMDLWFLSKVRAE